MIRRLFIRARCALGGHELVFWDEICHSWLCLCGTREEKGLDRLTWMGWGDDDA